MMAAFNRHHKGNSLACDVAALNSGNNFVSLFDRQTRSNLIIVREAITSFHDYQQPADDVTPRGGHPSRDELYFSFYLMMGAVAVCDVYEARDSYQRPMTNQQDTDVHKIAAGLSDGRCLTDAKFLRRQSDYNSLSNC
jgi:hypothetical protein